MEKDEREYLDGIKELAQALHEEVTTIVTSMEYLEGVEEDVLKARKLQDAKYLIVRAMFKLEEYLKG